MYARTKPPRRLRQRTHYWRMSKRGQRVYGRLVLPKTLYPVAQWAMTRPGHTLLLEARRQKRST